MGIFCRIREIPATVKHWWQRAVKGYSYRDVWSIDIWFETVMPQMLADLKHSKHGVPNECMKNEDGSEKDFDEAVKAWDEVLDRMIFCFREMNDNTCSQTNKFDNEYWKQWNKPFGKEIKKWFQPCEVDGKHVKLYRMIDDEVDPELKEKYWNRFREIEEYKREMQNEALDMFKKYFRDLWD